MADPDMAIAKKIAHSANMESIVTSIPNSRLNALGLGVRLVLAAANPFSGMSRESDKKASWQPLDPYGWPKWWPLGAFRGRAVPINALRLMHRVSLKARWHRAVQTKPLERAE